MKPVTAEAVDRVWHGMAELPGDGVPKLIKRMVKKQPVVLAYLMAVDPDLLNEDERKRLLCLGIAIWQIMSEGNPSLRRVTEKMLYQAEKKNVREAEHLGGTSQEGFWRGVGGMLDSYNQGEVLRFVVEGITEEPGEGEVIRDKAIGTLYLDLKTVIDCFDALPGRE